ncbi:hypothetical protein [Microbulbifer taiwanensis]|uniref:Transposase n=1 Tax=Microbulbifer taiwanensis TaxID=986746 RepID=A0ABW1YKI1_9GAMM|nr:hypothetical protein [Microbulbifer taiwanensis]
MRPLPTIPYHGIQNRQKLPYCGCQGYNGIAAVDKKHQIIVEAQAFGAGQEQHTLKAMLDGLRGRYRRTRIDEDILVSDAIVTANTGFSSDENNDYIEEEGINAYIPGNQFRSRGKGFKGQKNKNMASATRRMPRISLRRFPPVSSSWMRATRVCRYARWAQAAGI